MNIMAEKKPDDVMAEYLLKGAKMLAKTCPTCGSPLFVYKGRTFCVTCELEEEKVQEKGKGQGKKQVKAMVAEGQDIGKTIPVAGLSGRTSFFQGSALVCALETTLITLTERIATEPDPDRCLSLMNTVKKGIEALALLSQP
jgi:UPF0148 protein